MATSNEELLLIVDDHPRNIQLLGSLLAREGYRIAVATTGLQALAIAGKVLPDLILLDVMLPDLQGFDVCRQLRETPETAETPILFLTAKSETEDKVKGFRMGGTDYLTKPFEGAEVLARIRTQLALRRAQRQLKEQNRRLEELLQERTRDLVRAERQAAFSLLIKGIVHNLKNPLFTILGSFEMIQELQKEFKENMDFSQTAACIPEICQKTFELVRLGEASARTLSDLIQSLMAKSRSDKRESLEVVDLNEILRQEFSFLQADQQLAYKVKKRVHLASQPLPVEIVPVELVQVFQNLVRNALDALVDKADAELLVESGELAEEVFFRIGDNGTGIDEEHRPRLFEPFFTTKKTPDAEGRTGTGLGLYTCREIVQSYQGRIELDSALGKGTVFTVFLPRWR
jgi:signal transduction histidine kinase